jgi:hypothetical protein
MPRKSALFIRKNMLGGLSNFSTTISIKFNQLTRKNNSCVGSNFDICWLDAFIKRYILCVCARRGKECLRMYVFACIV